ncbi:MAG: LTA synthase family protein [Desulfitobacteriia bacterium]|jgi:phosphoglycerol transferase MdoB-like AlkP superfamily enzyme
MSYMGKVCRGFAKVFLKITQGPSRSVVNSYTFFKMVLMLTLCQTILTEIIQRGSIISALYWLAIYPLTFALNYLLTLVFFLFFLILTGRLAITFILSTSSLVLLALSSLAKKQFLGDPLFPWDFLRLDQVWNLLPQYSGEIMLALLFLALLILGLLGSTRFLIPAYQASWPLRGCLLLIIGIIVPLVVFYRHTPLESALKQANIEHIYWAQSENSLKNGFLFGFAMNLESIMIVEPEGYNSAEIKRIMEENTPSTPALALGSAQPDSKPNIVFILNEAFWDPTVLPQVSYSQNPLPFFQELRQKQHSGTMVSPVFGGSTANVEFEILTGLSTTFLPQGAIAYQQYIEHPIPSIARTFKNNGYVTTAIHPYHDWFYKRNTVFPNLGFDNFYSLKDFPEAEIKGEYVSDLEVSKKIAAELHKTREPAFIFAITMQNHGPYPEKRYPEKDIRVQGNLSPEGQAILETYVQGVHDADQALMSLLKSLEHLNEPTVVVFMGDHLPYLGKNYLVYKETGYIKDNENKWTAADTLKMRSLPTAVWFNYPTGLPNWEILSAKYLGNHLLELAGLQGTSINNFLADLAEKLPVYEKTVNINQKGQVSESLPAELKALERDYWLLQYDILFGRQYYQEYL